MRFESPTCLKEALASMARTPAPRPIAGGTDLLVAWHHQDKSDWSLLDLSQISSLRAHRLESDHLTLGALTSYWDVIRDADVCAEFPLLEQAARQVGAIQIQTRGTWAGNIANGSPAADGVLALLAYDASIVLQSVRGERVVPLDGYFTGYKQSLRAPDELIVAIRVPRVPRDAEWLYKVGARAAQTITKVGVAVTHSATGWRIAANSVAPFVCRCRHLEAAMDSGTLPATVAGVRALLDLDISPIDDLRSAAEYRANVLARLIHHWWRGRNP